MNFFGNDPLGHWPERFTFIGELGCGFSFIIPKIVGDFPAGYSHGMSGLPEIQASIRQLSPEDRAAFRAWYAEFDAQEWDRQMEADVAAGRIDWLVEEARDDSRSAKRGHSTF